jgi:hypothetical protein
MRRFFFVALLAVSCDRSPATHAPVPIVQRRLREAPMVFHPELPLIAQEDGARCHVWDLQSGLYRGAIGLRECRGWARPRPVIPADLAAKTPEEPRAEGDQSKDAGALVWAQSVDGRWIATARRHGRTARVWLGDTHRLLKEVRLELAPGAATLVEDLMWTRSGQLVIAVNGSGPLMWSPDAPDKHPESLADRSPDEYVSLSVDPGGRFIGFSGKGYRKPYGLVFAGVLGFVGERAKTLLLDERVDAVSVAQSTRWAVDKPVAFITERRPTQALDLCGRTHERLIALDPARGASSREFPQTRKVSALEPSADGRFALVLTDAGPPLEPCDSATDSPVEDDKRPLLTLWEPATGRTQDLLRAPVGGMAWAPGGARFAVAAEGHVRLYEGDDAHVSGSWEGREPVAFSADDGQIAFGSARGLVLHRLDGRGEMTLGAHAVAVAFGPQDQLAVATDAELELWSGKPPQRRASIPVRGVRRISWNARGDAVLLWTRLGRAFVCWFSGALPTEPPSVNAADLIGWSGSDELLARGADVIRAFRWTGHGVQELAARSLGREWHPSPTARWAVAAPDPDLVSGGYRLRAAPQEDTMFFDLDRKGHQFLSSGAFAGAPPEGLAFRLGQDVLRAPIVRAAEATFAKPTRDLGERFARGARATNHR